LVRIFIPERVFDMMKLFTGLLLVTLCLTMACGSSSNQASPGAVITLARTTMSSAPAYTTSAPSYTNTEDAGSISNPDRMIVRNGSLTLVVNDIPATLEAISGMAAGLQGYIVSSNTWKNGERVYGTISLRVPAENFDPAMSALAALAVEVTSKSTSSQDVTEEYTDLSARLKNLEATEQQLLTIMQQAQKIDDVLAVQAQLTDIRGQIEQTKGRMQYLERSSATSLIQVNLEQAKLEAKFTAARTSTKTGDEIGFTPDVAGGFTPYSFNWNFGDSASSTDQSPWHAYQKTGNYTVSLTVTDDRGNTATVTRQNYVTVTQGGWSVAGVVSAAWDILLGFGRVVVTLVIGILVFTPLWLIIGLIIWLVRRGKKKTPKK
jgi:PKD repeat protein